MSQILRRIANKAFLRRWQISNQRDFVAKLASESGLPHGFQDEIGFWALELSGRGYHPEILDRLTPRGMKECFPAAVLELLDGIEKKVPVVADVGSGPLSQLAYGSHTGRLQLIAIDPLAEVYAKLLDRNRLKTSYQRRSVPAEEISNVFGKGAFDIIWTRNAIDHASDVGLAFRSMATALAPAGYLLVSQFSREGTAEGWHGLHQHDLFLDDSERLMLQSRSNGTLSAATCISEGLGLKVLRSSGPTPGVKQWFEVIWTRSPER